ncbi:MAG: thioredoxin protein, partial [Gammaproteobacteria bacterium]|nr:thioredoxin protein [Gammaproteobacteria bacterium]
MANELDQEISPYLLQHKDNPVHWKAWGDPAFRLAKAENKPILISIGYAACHWCHVMAHESFEDPDIADFLNTHFICIKVDREERPDVDALYMQAVQMMQVPGGWPLNVFVTPEGRPFFGGTYFPPEPMYGRASFKQILHSVNKAWQTDQDKIHEHSEALTQALQHDTHYSKDSNLPALTSLYQVCEHMLSYIDKAEGGLQGAPKFPQLPMWLNLTDVAISQNNLDLLTAVKQTANALCQGGIYDHLDGGLMRYSTDSHWLVPHFEKMLYDNAQFLQLLAKLYSLDKNPLYKERAIETVNWLKQSMMTDCGAFACAIDADSEGVEGKYYVWSAEEINSILGRDTPLFNRVYGVSESGNWESYNILHRNHMAQISEPEAIKLAELRKKLLAERAKRIAPHRDDKVLADWNGLMISGLTYAAMAFERPDWLALAQSCYQAIIKHLADGVELYHMYRAGQKKHIGMLDDYANMVQAALLLYQATGNDDYLAQAKDWVQTVESHFRDPAGGYFSTSSKSQDLIAKVKLGQD